MRTNGVDKSLMIEKKNQCRRLHPSTKCITQKRLKEKSENGQAQ
jgi:hypothetical protein